MGISRSSLNGSGRVSCVNVCVVSSGVYVHFALFVASTVRASRPDIMCERVCVIKWFV
jgi:hypothetical protein